MSYKVFTRTFWRENKNGQWPDNLEPHMGRKHTLATVSTEEEAIKRCDQYNSTHKPGRYSRKAEYTQQ